MLWATVPLQAHPEIEEALHRCNERIAAAPGDATLYLERGELHARHNDLLAAHRDYQRAAAISPRLPHLDRARGSLALIRGQLAEANAFLNQALAQSPDDAEALVLRSRVLAARGDRPSALADLSGALALIPAPSPDLFLDRAALFAAPADAIRSVDEGIERIGPVPSLIVRALVLEESAGRVDDALARLDRVIAASERKESWLKTRGDLLRRAGREREARDSYAAARQALAGLPAWLRESPAYLDLAAALERLILPPP